MCYMWQSLICVICGKALYVLYVAKPYMCYMWQSLICVICGEATEARAKAHHALLFFKSSVWQNIRFGFVTQNFCETGGVSAVAPTQIQ